VVTFVKVEVVVTELYRRATMTAAAVDKWADAA
jgi:hypothetical protein